MLFYIFSHIDFAIDRRKLIRSNLFFLFADLRSWSEARFNHKNIAAVHFAISDSVGNHSVFGVDIEIIAN